MIPFILGALAAIGLSELSKKGKMPIMANGGGVGIDYNKFLKAKTDQYRREGYDLIDAIDTAFRDLGLETDGKFEKREFDKVVASNPNVKKAWTNYKKDSSIYVKDGYYVNPYQMQYAQGGGVKAVEHFRVRGVEFMQDDLVELEKAIKENDKEEIDKFFSYWGIHLDSLKTTSNDRMFNFLKDDLGKLEKSINENDKEEIEKFFSYWRIHLKSLKYAKGGGVSVGKERVGTKEMYFKYDEQTGKKSRLYKTKKEAQK